MSYRKYFKIEQKNTHYFLQLIKQQCNILVSTLGFSSYLTLLSVPLPGRKEKKKVKTKERNYSIQFRFLKIILPANFQWFIVVKKYYSKILVNLIKLEIIISPFYSYLITKYKSPSNIFANCGSLLLFFINGKFSDCAFLKKYIILT